jgi:hypothetical protein
MWSHFQVLSAEQVRQRLQETAVDLGVAGRDPFFGYGRVDVFSALNMPLNPPVGGIVLETRSHVFFMLCAEIVAAGMGSAGSAVVLRYRRQRRTVRAKNR